MPRVNLYVKQEDWEAYQAIQNKPEWLHNAIHNVSILTPKENVSIHTSSPTTPESVSIHTPPVEPNVSILTSQEPPVDDDEEFTEPTAGELIPDPQNKNRAWDPEIEEWVRVKRVDGKLLRAE